MFTGTGFAHPISGTPLTSATSGNTTVPIEIGVDQRIQRHAAEQTRGRIAQPVGRPRMRHLVNGQREQQNHERDETCAKLMSAMEFRALSASYQLHA